MDIGLLRAELDERARRGGALSSNPKEVRAVLMNEAALDADEAIERSIDDENDQIKRGKKGETPVTHPRDRERILDTLMRLVAQHPGTDEQRLEAAQEAKKKLVRAAAGLTRASDGKALSLDRAIAEVLVPGPTARMENLKVPEDEEKAAEVVTTKGSLKGRVSVPPPAEAGRRWAAQELALQLKGATSGQRAARWLLGGLGGLLGGAAGTVGGTFAGGAATGTVFAATGPGAIAAAGAGALIGAGAGAGLDAVAGAKAGVVLANQLWGRPQHRHLDRAIGELELERGGFTDKEKRNLERISPERWRALLHLPWPDRPKDPRAPGDPPRDRRNSRRARRVQQGTDHVFYRLG